VFNHILLFLVVLLLSASIWVSDLAIVSIFLLIFALLFFHYYNERNFRFNWAVYLYTFAGIVGSYFFIRYAKKLASGVTRDYATFNSLDTFFQGLIVLKNEFISVYTFQSKEWVFSIFAWLVLVGIIFLVFNRSSISVPKRKHRWLAFFIFDFLAVLGVVLLSKWVFFNGMGRWYFVSNYISLSVVVLILIDNLKLTTPKSFVIKYIISAAIFVGALSTIHYLKFVWPKTLRPKIDVKAEFLALGEIGIIGEFWNSYISACPDPSKIKATAHDKSVVRNFELVDEVFAQPKIYVIRDMWMKSFPDTLEQFGHILIKEGDSFKIADCDVNRYILIKSKRK